MSSISTPKQPQDVVVLMVPFPLQGHLNQLLHLSRLISAHHITVHYIGTDILNCQARQRAHGFHPQSISNIIFHDIPSLSCHSPLPDPNSNTPKKSPFHLQSLLDISMLLRKPFNDLLRHLSVTCKRVVIIYDSLMGSVVQDFVNLPNAEGYTFHSVSAFTMFLFLWENKGRPFCMDEKLVENVPSLEGCFTPDFLQFIRYQHKYIELNSGRIYNTCRVIESPFLDLLARSEISGNKKQWALGPFNPINTNSGHEKRIKESCESDACKKCLDWLNDQAPKSVLFVSFGTTTSLSNEQIEELAIGLEKSEQKFIWVLREADRGDSSIQEKIVDLLPKGFLERTENRGVIIRGDWAPQLEILGHFAIGGFLSHCGWNSCMESVTMGVPIATWPMHSDQPRNAFLMTNVLKIGVEVKNWASREDIVGSETVERAVRRLVASEEGEAIRQRAAKMGGDVRRAAAEGGVARKEIDSFIKHICR